MSRQSKKKNQASLSKKSKGSNKGAHFAEGEKHSKYPSHQPAPNWVRPTGAKGWFNTKAATKEKLSESKKASTDLSWVSRPTRAN
jgi:hypothetical protein